MDIALSENRSRQPSLEARNINDMNSFTLNTKSSPSPVCRRHRSGLVCGAQLCGGGVLPPHPWAPKRKHEMRKMSRMSRRNGGPQRCRNLFGPDEVAAVDTDGHEISYQVQHHNSMTFSNKDCLTKNFDDSHRVDDTNNKIHVVKNNSDDECNIVDVECVDDSKNETCDADRQVVLLPKPLLLVFASGIHEPFLPPVNDFSKARSADRNAVEEVSDIECSRWRIVSARKQLSPSSRVCLIPQPQLLASASGVQKPFLPPVNDFGKARDAAEDFSYTGCSPSRIVSARKGRLPPSKQAKLARMDRQCLRFGRFDESSGQERMCEDASLASPSASFSRICLNSPAQTPRRPHNPSRRRLFGSDDSDAYFYDISTSSHYHQDQSYDKKTASIELNSLFNACNGHLTSNSYRDK